MGQKSHLQLQRCRWAWTHWGQRYSCGLTATYSRLWPYSCSRKHGHTSKYRCI